MPLRIIWQFGLATLAASEFRLVAAETSVRKFGRFQQTTLLPLPIQLFVTEADCLCLEFATS